MPIIIIYDYVKCYNLKMSILVLKLAKVRTQIDNILDFKIYNRSINSKTIANNTRSVLRYDDRIKRKQIKCANDDILLIKYDLIR
jgi:hypothetical protein